jgi:hypothetical protein
MLEIGGILTVVGLVATLISFTYNWVHPTPSFLNKYDALVNRQEGNYNLILLIAGPIVLIMGIFYFGEQLVLRRRFERLLDTPKRSEFSSRRRDLEDLARRLPEGFMAKIEAKESEFKSKRTT